MSRSPQPADGVVALSEEECRRRLARATTGYLSTTDRALPVIVPVAVTMAEGEVLLAPVFGGPLATTATPPRDAIVALGIGQLDKATCEREHVETWSVVAQGTLCSPPHPSGACVLHAEVLMGWRRGSVPVAAAG